MKNNLYDICHNYYIYSQFRMRISSDIESCKACVYRQLLFGDLTEREYELINQARTEKIFRRGEVIIKENDPIDSFLYLRKGLIKLYKTDEHGKDHLISINKPGDFVSLLSIFSNQISGRLNSNIIMKHMVFHRRLFI